MRNASKLLAASIACAILGLCVGAANASPWRPGKNTLTRLSSQGQSVAIEHIKVTPGLAAIHGRRHR